MMAALDLVRRFAPLDAPVLIEGETGTGKELVARALHRLGGRADKPLVTIDCAALPETLAESELFGHERGSFTGADRPYPGRIESADGGTLFLDEINSLSHAVQAKLLRFLEDQEVTRIGKQRPLKVDVRLITASNVPLEDLVRAGRMRADFFYRLSVLRIQLPPLRERLDDIPLLVTHFLSRDPLARTRGVTRISDGALEQLHDHPWPGNVREFRNVLRRSIVFGAPDGVLRRCEFAGTKPDAVTGRARSPIAASPPSFRAWMREREREYLSDLVKRHPRASDQAAVSGLPQRTLYRKIRGLNLPAAAANLR
jgi:transcriptional regulator with PAS, ATPase and Fis domain